MTINDLMTSKTDVLVDTSLVTSLGEEMDKAARAMGAKQSAVLGPVIASIAKARQDYEGGPFKVMFKVTSNMSQEEIDGLPIPGSTSGNHPAIYKLKKPSDKKAKDVNYYDVLSDSLAGNVAKSTRINLLELSMGDPSKVNMSSVPQDIKDMTETYRMTEVSRLKGELTTSRSAVNSAFELLFQIRAVKQLDGCDCYPIMALNPDGKTVSETDVENTRTPMLVTTTLKDRQALDVKRLSISTFKKLKPLVAKENGGTYAALMKTIEKGSDNGENNQEDGNKPSLIATLDKFQARIIDIHSYMDGVWSDKTHASYQDLLKIVGPRGPAGSDDFALSLYSVYTMLGDIYRHDQIRARADKLKTDDATGERKAS